MGIKFFTKGNVSLCIAGGGFIASVLILHFKIFVGTTAQLITVLSAAFEAGTAGALADWFAVSGFPRDSDTIHEKTYKYHCKKKRIFYESYF